VSLHDEVIRTLDRFPPSVGLLVYDRELWLLAEREPGDAAMIIILDPEGWRKPSSPPVRAGRAARAA
jgi:hypothetical protein